MTISEEKNSFGQVRQQRFWRDSQLQIAPISRAMVLDYVSGTLPGLSRTYS